MTSYRLSSNTTRCRTLMLCADDYDSICGTTTATGVPQCLGDTHYTMLRLPSRSALADDLDSVCLVTHYAPECSLTVTWHMRKRVPNLGQEWLKRVANKLGSRQKIRGIVKFISENRDLFHPY
ncbi:hypothetical protein AVEN_212473-1 [Araneus ventricosus]|uniref:Uncharacterized protein n=1 Tax=Araneus ventricosus TaxID=182803 RepID=A0A4Y2QHA8_ARAVE|nr:hypothetical protein AVEN_212473-1 [Araneus ventricosus]